MENTDRISQINQEIESLENLLKNNIGNLPLILLTTKRIGVLTNAKTDSTIDIEPKDTLFLKI